MSGRGLITLSALGIAVGIQYFWLNPILQRLPADYADELTYTASSHFRDSVNAPWISSVMISRRVDQTLVSSGDHAIIQGDLHWTNTNGIVEFESTGVYGVDRNTRRNLPGYGNVERRGQYLFPPNVEAKTYYIWDPQFVGGRVAKFQRELSIDGMPVLEFQFTANAMDESAGYSHLADVPERYLALTDGTSTAWVEPLSGIVVDYEEQGRSYFFDHNTSQSVGDFYIFKARYTPSTREAKLQSARSARHRIRTLTIWLPLALLTASLAVLAHWVYGWKRRRRHAAPTAGAARTGKDRP